MGLFSRGRDRQEPPRRDPRSAQIAAFWQWWTDEGATATADAIAGGSPEAAADALAAAVAAIDPALDWELGPGRHGAEHILMVTAAGDSSRRNLVHRWLKAAPPPDGTWEFAAARTASPSPADATLGLDGVEIDVASVVFAARERGPALNVTLFHPQLGRLSAERRAFASFWLLDCVLGEEPVETWIGRVNCSDQPPPGALPLAQLPAAVDELAQQFLGDDGRPAWQLATATLASGGKMPFMARTPMRPSVEPHLDTYVGVTLKYRDTLPNNGMPTDHVLQDLRAFEDHLEQRLGGSGAVVAHQTYGGERTLHVFVDGTTPAVEQIRALVPGWQHGKVKLVSRYDSDWEGVAHLQGG